MQTIISLSRTSQYLKSFNLFRFQPRVLLGGKNCDILFMAIMIGECIYSISKQTDGLLWHVVWSPTQAGVKFTSGQLAAIPPMSPRPTDIIYHPADCSPSHGREHRADARPGNCPFLSAHRGVYTVQICRSIKAGVYRKQANVKKPTTLGFSLFVVVCLALFHNYVHQLCRSLVLCLI